MVQPDPEIETALQQAQRVASVRIEDSPRHDPETVPGLPSPELSRAEVVQQASKGVVVVWSWGFASLLIGFVGNVALARLLVPADFGLVAIGASITFLASAVADAGLSAGLIRRPERPSPGELKAIAGFQLGSGTVVMLSIAAVALTFGRNGAVVAAMTLALPIYAFQTPGVVQLNRRMRFGRLTASEGSSVIAFYMWSMVTVLLGAGVWGLATGTVIRALTLTATTVALSGLGFVMPRVDHFREAIPVLHFGVRFQATALVLLTRDLLVNTTVTSVAGVATLGQWNLTWKVMQVPFVLFNALWRIALPGMAHVLAAREDPAPIIERGARVISVAGAIALSIFVGLFTPLVTVLFGQNWSPVADALPWAAVGLLVAGSISAATAGYVQAANRPQDTLRAASAYAVVWIGATAALLPALGLVAVGIGWILGGTTEATILARATKRLCGADVTRSAGLPLAAGVAGCAAAGAAGVALPAGLPSAALAATAGLAVTLLVLAATSRPALVETWTIARVAAVRAVRGAAG